MAEEPSDLAKANERTPETSLVGIGSNTPQPVKKLYYANFDPGPLKLTTDIPGVLLDFNYGVRIQVPEGNYHVRFIDKDTNTILYDAPISKAIAY